MDLVKQLESDLVAAMKAQEKLKLTVLREIKSNMKLANIDQKKEMNDDLLIDVVSKGIKMRKESIQDFEKGNRQDLIDKTMEEIHILEGYLPEQLSMDEVLKIIDDAITEVGANCMKDMGKVMGLVTPKVKGRIDMKQVSEEIKKRLS